MRHALLLLLSYGLVATAHADEPAYTSTVHARPKRDSGSAPIVLTARELAERNVQNLAQALDLIPELQVRQGGQGVRLDLRGAKQRSILLIIDGVPIDEPYFGAFDLSSIPITDIVEIRVQLSPASPLEGPGGDGGIVEVFTLRAVGSNRIQARVVGSTNPEAEGAVTGRVGFGRDRSWGTRLSVGGRFADPGYPVTNMDGSHGTFFNRQVQAYGAARLEHQTDRGRFALDGWYGHRSFAIPPSDTEGAAIQLIKREDAGRLVVGGEAHPGGVRVAVGAYGEVLSRTTDLYPDYTLSMATTVEELFTARAGAALDVEHEWLRREVHILLVSRLSVDGEGARVAQTGAQAAWGFSTWGEAAAGVRLRWRMLRAEAAFGLLVPFDHPAGWWPEGKLTFAADASRWLSVMLVGAYKGRLPTLRELYDPIQGNADLDPEKTWHGELRVELRPHPLVISHTAAYVKRIDGFIRLDPDARVPVMDRRNLNLGTLDVRGFEAGIDVARGKIFGGGVDYLYQDASALGDDSIVLGAQPIPNLPAHRVDAYLSSEWRHRVGALLRFRYVSSREVQNVMLTPYEVLDLTVWGKINRQLRASLRIDNLTNNRYQQLPTMRVLGTNAMLTVEGAWE